MDNFGNKIELLKVRKLGDLLNATFSFTGQNYKPMLKAVFMYALPFYLAAMLLSYFFAWDIFSLMLRDPFSESELLDKLDFVNLGLQSLLFMGLSMVAYCVYMAVIYEYIIQYVSRDDYHNIQPQDLRANAFGNIGNVLLSFLGVMLMMIGICLLMIIPILGAIAAIFLIYYAIVPISILFLLRIREKTGFAEAIKRAFALTKGRWWQSFGLYLVTGLMVLSVTLLPQAAIGLLQGLSLNSGGSGNLSLILILQLLAMVLGFLVGIIYLIATAFRYFSLVEEKEGEGLMAQVEGFGENTGETEEGE